MKLKPIDQQVVVIVGATSGIGRAAALAFANRGARVVVSGRSQPELDSLVNEIRGQGGQALGVAAEVTEFGQVKTIADRAVEIFGRIDTWIHSTAVMMYAPVEDIAAEEFKRLIDVNVNGQAYGAMAALPHLRRTGRGALIHLTSVEAQRSIPLQSAYAASKQAIRGFLEVLRVELEEEGLPVSVTNIMPASINTPLYDRAVTRLGVKPRPVPPVYQPQVVVDALLYAAENPVREIVVGGAGKGLSLIQRLSPRLADRFLIRYAYSGQYSDVPKRSDAPSNLFHHIEGYDRVEGSYSNEALPVGLTTGPRLSPVVLLGLTAFAVAAALVATRVIQERRRVCQSPLQATRQVIGDSLEQGLNRVRRIGRGGILNRQRKSRLATLLGR